SRKQEAGNNLSPAVSASEAKLIDSDNDGIPDVEELRTYQDRDSFRRWFTAIAETQFYQLSDQWNTEQRDCAGLARFAIREALRRHDRTWFQKMAYSVRIFLRSARLVVNGSNGANDWVVYHTGSSPTDKGTVKKVELSVLDHHPDPRWRPVESNKNFLGFYRLKILQ